MGDETADEGAPPREADAHDAPIVGEAASRAEGDALAVGPQERGVIVHVAEADVPGAPLQVGDEEVPEGGTHGAAQRGAVGHEGECVGPIEYLLRDELHAHAVTIGESALPAHGEVYPAAIDIAIPDA